MIDQVLNAVFESIDKLAQARVGDLFAVGDKYQLIVGRNAIFLDEKGPSGTLFNIKLIQLKIPEGTNDSLSLTSEQRRGEGKINIDEFDIFKLQAFFFEHDF